MSSAPVVEEVLPDLRNCGDDPERTVPQRVKAYVSSVREHLTSLHRNREAGIEVIQRHSDLTDRLVRRLFHLAEESLLESGGELERGLCVVAVGGYARREMNIHSDVDLLVVYRGELTAYVTAISERLQYWMWDAGLQVGCAVRTSAETVELGRADNTVRTAVLTARFLCGDGEFFHEFSDIIRHELLPDVELFIDEQFRVIEQRHARYGESAFLLQPNIKEGVGGLRDYHSAFWVARAAQPTSRDFEDFLHFGLLTDTEMRDYRAALNFLWRVRNELHLETGRGNDQISFEQQELIADSLGYGGGAEGELAVERFMRDYYRHVRNIESYSELVMQQCRGRVSSDSGQAEVIAEEDGFRVVDGAVEVQHVQQLRADPLRLFTIFAVSQRYQVPLSRMARRMIRQNLDLVDDELRRNPDAREAFLAILRGEHRVMRSLVTMNEDGLLAAFLPEWDHIVCRWQQVVYHTYTVDIHSIFLVEELRRLWRGKYEAALPRLTGLMQGVVDHEVLYLGCLLHDVGKGFGGDHSNKGVPRAKSCIDRLGLVGERADRVIFLVRYHLLMSHLAQSRDLSDPKLIFEFAQTCGDRLNLRNLYLLTFADIRASSVEAWTEWKGQLLEELFERTAELLESGGGDRREKAMELIEARVEVRRLGALNELKSLGIANGKIEGYFDVMPRRYFIAHTPRQIARHAKVVIRHAGGETMETSFREMRGGFTEFVLCVRDQPGLYAEVAGVLTACHFDILGSHVYTSKAGFALEIYRLTTPPGGREERRFAWRELEEALRSVLLGGESAAEFVARRRPSRVTPSIRRFAPLVQISNEESEFYTLVDVTANDRRGLLYDLTSVIARHGGSIYISKVGSVLDQVKDTFYIKDTRLKKFTDPKALEKLHGDLSEAAGRGGVSDDG